MPKRHSSSRSVSTRETRSATGDRVATLRSAIEQGRFVLDTRLVAERMLARISVLSLKI
jgi:anti-sigma28 factor (negative regulator of flagellin synthesis)